ncbi:sporulation integral membrane protein YlbJ [Peribacillus saganii]|uniref:Sporulation integral membrane protein YlbJ n=1 Tax=Peribacillus saganii TaxID=2303992 RepID=A0A372LSK1_9BACI|nr:sporulation integral membrane protein YlbJ [Peribacillus saganii]RFU71158.1 sporulation integral membrane protein YlbJ [Peribacillus saganii]
MYKSRIKTIFLALSVTIMAGGLITFPQESFEASIRGLNMWWEIVFPSLLPFFIMSEMLIGFGVVKFIGVLLEPLMRPLFKVPGVGGFVWAMGMASGYPSGAKLTARLRQEKQLTRIEAERLVSFTNSSNPLFIFGAVSIGFFYNPNLGIILASSHYLGNFCVGLLMRFHGKKENLEKKPKRSTLSIKQALRELHRTRIKEKRPLGKLLGDAVLSSIQTLLMIGGFIILFSVINKLLYHMKITGLLAKGVEYVLVLLGFPDVLSIPLISGMFEITLGSQMTSGVQEATLMQQAIITSFILAFCGFSVQAQVASILSETDIRFYPFFFARIAHGFLAGFITFVLWNPVYEGMHMFGRPSNSYPVSAGQDAGWETTLYHAATNAGPLITIGFLVIYIILYAARSRK